MNFDRQERKELSKSLGLPDTFSDRGPLQEDVLDRAKITRGYSEPFCTKDEYSSAKRAFEKCDLDSLQCVLLEKAKQIEWKKHSNLNVDINNNNNNSIDFEASKLPSQNRASLNNIKSDRNVPKGQSTRKNDLNNAPLKKQKRELPELQYFNDEKKGIWLQRLASNEPLSRLALEMKVPTFSTSGQASLNLLKVLYQNQIPQLRALWLIKIIHLNAKRTDTEPQDSWTRTLLYFLRDQISQRNLESVNSPFSYTLKLIQWSFFEKLINPEVLFEELSKFIVNTRPEEVMVYLQIMTAYLHEMANSPQGVLKKIISSLVEKCLHITKSGLPEFTFQTKGNSHPQKISDKIQSFLRFFAHEVPHVLTILEPKVLQSFISLVDTTFEDPFLSQIESFYKSAWEEKEENILQLNLIHSMNNMTNETNDHLFDRILQLEHFPALERKPSDINDVSTLFNQYFVPSLNRAISDSTYVATVEDFVILLCQWVVEKRNHFGECYRISLAASILVKLKQYDQEKLANISFQSLLMKFIDFLVSSSENTSSQNFPRIANFFGYLIQIGIFSHDAFVRTLISRGILENDSHIDEKKMSFYVRFITQLPICPGDSFQHENNQRNQVIATLNLSPFDDTEVLQSTEALVLSFLSGRDLEALPKIKENFDRLTQTRIQFSHFLKSQLCSSNSSAQLARGFQICETLMDLTTLSEAIILLLQDKDKTNLFPTLVTYARKFEQIFICKNNLSLLYCSLQPHHYIPRDYMIELIRYPEIKKIDSKIRIEKKATTSDRLLQEFVKIESFVTEIGIFGQLLPPEKRNCSIEDFIKGLCGILLNTSERLDCTTLFSRLSEIYLSWSDVFLNILSSYLMTSKLTSPEPLDHVMSSLERCTPIKSILYFFSKKIDMVRGQLSKSQSLDPNQVRMTVYYLHWSQILIQSKEKKPPLFDVHLGVFLPVFELYKVIIKFNLKDKYQTLYNGLSNVIQLSSFQVYLVQHKTAELCGDLEARRTFGNFFDGRVHFPSTDVDDQENLVALSKKIQEVLWNRSKWESRETILRLLIIFESSERLFSHSNDVFLPNKPHFQFNAQSLTVFHLLFLLEHSQGELILLHKLVSKNGLPEPFRALFLSVTTEILACDQVLKGEVSLSVFLKELFAQIQNQAGNQLFQREGGSSHFLQSDPQKETGVHFPEGFHHSFPFSKSLPKLNQNFLDLMLTCLGSLSERTLQTVFDKGILTQLKAVHTILESSLQPATFPDNETSVQTRLLMRLALLNPTLHIINQKEIKNALDSRIYKTSALLLSFLNYPSVQNCETLFSYLINILDVLLNELTTGEEKGTLKKQFQKEVRNQLQSQFEVSEMPEYHRLRVEQLMPFLKTPKNIQRFHLLEDWETGLMNQLHQTSVAKAKKRSLHYNNM